MSVDPGYRPGLDDILSYLNYSPAFLTPCLDVPATSVVHEDTDSLEMHLPSATLAALSVQNTTTSMPAAFFSQSSQRHHSWQEKLKYKRKTFSVPGLASLSKSAKSSFTNRSPVSSSRSSSLCSANMHSSSICGLPSCGIIGGWAIGSSGDVVCGDGGDRTKCEGQDLKDQGTPKSERKYDRHEVVCDVDIEVYNTEHRTSLGSDHRRCSYTAGSDKEDLSSGYVSQNSKGESKQICQTVTSL